jgi:hypothetical protein
MLPLVGAGVGHAPAAGEWVCRCVGFVAGRAEVALAPGTPQTGFSLALATMTLGTLYDHALQFTCSSLATPTLLTHTLLWRKNP